ncbi:MAG: 30S ribosome-binding factor RbfA [Alphaproteobacteria bacterium]|nr:30S ribosome-binding factor RbfA [Alphaproteobacteria bacterium]
MSGRFKSAAPRRGGGGQRLLRVGEELRHALAAIIQRGELKDHALIGRSITVTEVKVAPDIKHATVFVTPLGGVDAGGTDSAELLAALGRAQAFLRARLAEEVQLRFAPRLSFQLDPRFEATKAIETLLRSDKVQRDLSAGTEPEDGEPGDGA